MRITTVTISISFAALVNSLGMSTGTPPKTRDLLATFGMSDEQGTEQSNLDTPSRTETSLRARSRSPPAHARLIAAPTTITSSNGIEYELNQLHYICIYSYMKPNRLFKLRRYTFPSNKPIRLITRGRHYSPMPNGEQIVLSTPDGDVFAILETSRVFAGIYTYDPYVGHRARAKINMESGVVTALTPDEIKATPVGLLRQIPMYFRVERINENPSRD